MATPHTAQVHRAQVARAPMGLMALAAVAVVVPAVLLTGAVAAPVAGLADPGVLVRWGLPVVRAIHDVAAALTVGLLVLAATIIPETTATNRRVTATRWASASAVVWVVAALAGLVLSFADISSTPLGDPTFAAQFQSFVLSIEVLRVAAISLGLALVVAIGASVARHRGAMVALAALSVLAVLPLALAGHAAGSASHDTAVNSLAVHLVASVLWVGGLLALVVLRPLLGKGLAVSVARYSTLAGWCFALVALSGVQNAWIRLGSLSALGSPYGVLVIGKVAALGVLGLAGLQQRRVVVGRMATDEGARALFARLAVVEVVVMGAAFGLATALSRSAPPVPDLVQGRADPVQALTGYPAPSRALHAGDWLTLWQVDWLWLTVAVVAVGLYLAGVVRLTRRGDRWPVLRTVSWVAGWLIFVWATNGAAGVYGRVQFSVAHDAAHDHLDGRADPARPRRPGHPGPAHPATRPDKTLGPREILLGLVHSRLLRVLGNPVVAAALFFGSLVVFYYSPLFELSLRTHTGHVLMVIHFLLTGYLFAWVLIGVDPGPPKWAPSLRLLILFATISFHAFFGVALTTGTTLLAPDFFEQLHLPWGPDLLVDQRNAGAVAWGVGEVPTVLLAMLVAVAWVRSDAAETRRGDRQADRDDDAELRAYNARLAAAAARDKKPTSLTGD